MTVIADCLRFAGVPERISEPAKERFVTVKLNGGGAVERQIGSGKTPVPFTGYRVRPGQFIYSRIDARNGAFAIVPAALEGAVVSKDFPVFDVRSDVAEADYLRHFFLSGQLEALIRARSRGATNRQRIKEDEFLGFPLQLPPLPEQRRIAAILDHADGLRAKRRQVLAHLDTMPLAIFHEMFGDTCRNPLSFPTVQIRAIAKKFSDGPFGSNLKSSHYVKDGVPVIRLQNIGVGYYHDKDRAFVSAEHYSSLAKHDCQPGDILIATLGDPNLRACIHPESLPLALNKADCIQFRIDPRVADNVWACWLLNSPGTTSLATSLAHGQTRTRIAMGQLRELKVPLPPLSLQREFAERITALDIARGRTIEASAADDHLFASLQSRAFRGEL